MGLRRAGDRHPAGGPTPRGRQTLVVGSHHCPGSQARGCGPTPSGRQALLNGSQYCPGSHAELTAGVPIVVTAIAAAANMTTAANLPTRFRIAELLESMECDARGMAMPSPQVLQVMLSTERKTLSPRGADRPYELHPDESVAIARACLCLTTIFSSRAM